MSPQDSTLGVSILVGLLIVVLVSTITVIAADQTVFDSEHAIETIENEGVAGETTAVFRNQTRATIQAGVDEQANASRQSDPLLDNEQVGEIADSAVTERYVEEELIGHFERSYDYIGGDRETLELVFDFGEPRQTAIDGTETAEREALARRDGTVTSPDAVADERLVITPFVASELSPERNITSDGGPPSELDTAATASVWTGLLSILLPIIVVALLGGLYLLSDRSIHRAGNATGAAFVASGLMGLLVTFGGGAVARGVADGRLDFESEEFEPLSDGVVAIVASLFDTILVYSVVLALVGVAVLAVVFADDHGYFDRFKRDSTGSVQAEQNDDRATGGDGQSLAADRTGSQPREPDETDSQPQETDKLASQSQDSGQSGDKPTAEEYDPDQYDEHGFRKGTSDENATGRGETDE